MGKTALIFGCSGQDGSYLAELLLSKGYEVHGTVRRSSTYPAGNERIEHLRDKVHLHYADMTDPFSIMWAIKKSNPDEIYNLAAQSHVQVSWEIPWYTAQTTGIGVLNLLEAMRVLDCKAKVYQASTSEMYRGDGTIIDEKTPFDPISPYGSAKMYGHNIAHNYREAFGMFIACGILFNHESPRRGKNFVTKKIVDEAKKHGKVHLGNTTSARDWGAAWEYVEAMWMMLQEKKPDDYIIATGETNTIADFIGYVEKHLGKKIKVIIDKEYKRPNDVHCLKGNPAKAKKKLGWTPKVKAEELAKIMYDYEN